MRSPLYINQSLARDSQARDFLFGEKFTAGESHGLLTEKVQQSLLFTFFGTGGLLAGSPHGTA